MKKILSFFLVVVFLFTFSSCYEPEIPENMSAEETLQYYFQQWNNKDVPRMNAVCGEHMKSKKNEEEIKKLISVKLLNCKEPEIYELNTEIDVSFTSLFQDDYQGLFQNGINERSFCLRKDEKGMWKIVDWGPVGV